MKHDKFDVLTRQLATSTSRRQALKTLGGAMLAGILAPIVGYRPAWGQRRCSANTDCPPEFSTCCRGECVNVTRDPDNCGGCGLRCSVTEACSGGMCAPCQHGWRRCGRSSNTCVATPCKPFKLRCHCGDGEEFRSCQAECPRSVYERCAALCKTHGGVVNVTCQIDSIPGCRSGHGPSVP
jgi:hypothetical protein